MKMKTTLTRLFVVALLLGSPTALADSEEGNHAEKSRSVEASDVLTADRLTFPLELDFTGEGYALASNPLYACFPPGTPGNLCGGGCPVGYSCGTILSYPNCIQGGPLCVPRCDMSVDQTRFCPPWFSDGGEQIAVLEGCEVPSRIELR